jgi:phosphopantetheinyl transferase
LPFIQSIVSEQPGEWLVARCDVTLERYPFLRDHTFGREVSTASDLLGWSIMPLTLSMEMLAEGAAALLPGLSVVGMKDVRAHRWIALERPRVPVQIIARRTGPRQVGVEIREAEADDAGSPALPMVEGTVLLAESYPEPPLPSALALSDEVPSQWAPERLYEDVMFHGPSLQGVASMDRLGREGAEATLKVLSYDGLFATGAGASVVTDGVLLDQVGQVVGFWAEQVPEQPCLVPPFRLDSLQLFGPPLPAGELVKCRAWTSFIPDRQVRSTLEVVDARGRVWARLEGWQNRRFELPHTFYRLLLSTRDIFLSNRWSVPIAAPRDAAGAVVCRIGVEDFLDGWFTTHGGFWRRVFVYLVLGERERALWHALRAPEPRRVEWLLGWIAAKDAVRHYVRERDGLELCPADIEILPDAKGRPLVAGAWTARVAAVPIVSVSHSEGTAVAVATGPDGASGIGVDLERVGRVKAGMEAVAFTEEERSLLASLPPPDGEWPVRLWCAKEAAAKATGEGLVRGPQAFVVNGIDRASGRVQIGLPHGMAGAAGAPLTVATAREGDLVIATCVQVGGGVPA